jgi:hypothetical protein
VDEGVKQGANGGTRVEPVEFTNTAEPGFFNQNIFFNLIINEK